MPTGAQACRFEQIMNKFELGDVSNSHVIRSSIEFDKAKLTRVDKLIKGDVNFYNY